MIRRWTMAVAAFACAATLIACAEDTLDAASPVDDSARARSGTAAGMGDAKADGATDAATDAAAAMRRFLASLDASSRDDAVAAFDTPARIAWHYVPQSRTGVPLDDLDAAQRDAVFGLVGTALSERGTGLARGIVALEGTLRAVELAAFNPMALRRDPGLYFLQTFGAPDDARPWGWRFEGHHLSINVTRVGPDTQIVAPLFMGANPARIPDGPQAGVRVLAGEEDLGFALLQSLDATQRARAVIRDMPFGDIVTRADPVVGPMAFAGLPAAEMTPAQRQRLRALLAHYAGRMADAAAAAQLQRIDAAGFERLHFAWAGASQPGEPHYYRVHGPTVLVEYDNSQDGANHIHTVWRDLENDFGGDALRRHHASAVHHPAGDPND